MNEAQIAKIIAAVIATVNAENKPANLRKAKNYGVVAKRKAYAPKLSAVPVDAKADRMMKRLASIGRGFNAKGIKVTFDKATGKFDNVKPYKAWLSEGLRVRKGEHGVMGLFHSSQCEAFVVPVMPSTVGFPVTVLPAESREHHLTHSA